MGVQTKPFTLFQKFETRKRSLRYDLNALADFEQEVGMGFPQLMSSKAIFAATRGLLWSGLKSTSRGLTIDMAGELIQQYLDASEKHAITDILSECILAAQEHGALKAGAEEDEATVTPPLELAEGNATSKPTSTPAEG